jgi:hypothetical protein
MASLDFIRAGVWLVLGCSMLTPPSGATGWGLTLIAKAIGPLVTGAVTYRVMLTHCAAVRSAPRVWRYSHSLSDLPSPESPSRLSAIAKGYAQETRSGRELRVTLLKRDPPLSVVPEITMVSFALDPHQCPRTGVPRCGRPDRADRGRRLLLDSGGLLGKGVVMSVPGRVYKRCGCLNPDTRRRWGSHCPRLTRTGHGSWYLTVELPTGPSGTRRRLRRGGYRTGAEAQRAVTGLRRRHRADRRRVLLTTRQWLWHWVATRLRPRPATLRSYHQHIHQHLIPHLGGTVLRELCLDDVQSAFAILARNPTRYGRARAASTLHRIRATLRVALNAAMRRGLIEVNPARYLELPQPHDPGQWCGPSHA